jgi:hypothetical protein
MSLYWVAGKRRELSMAAPEASAGRPPGPHLSSDPLDAELAATQFLVPAD